jgi:hypothetical protein
MQLTAEQCEGLDDLLIEVGLIPSSRVLSPTHENSRQPESNPLDDRESRIMAELNEIDGSESQAWVATTVRPTGSSSHPRLVYPHVVDEITGCGRVLPAPQWDQFE